MLSCSGEVDESRTSGLEDVELEDTFEVEGDCFDADDEEDAVDDDEDGVLDVEPDLPNATVVEVKVRATPTSAHTVEPSTGLNADTSDRSMCSWIEMVSGWVLARGRCCV